MSHDSNWAFRRISLGTALLASAALAGVGCKNGDSMKRASAGPATEAIPVTVVGSRADASAATPSATADRISRGRYLVTIASCNDCHTPIKLDPKLGVPVPDMTRALSGHPEGAPSTEAKPGAHDQAVIGPTSTSFRLPSGTVYAANLTPDPETGLGRWDEATFIATMRTGRHLGIKTGRPVMPPMPWMNIAHMTDEDLAAVFAYLRSIPPVKNQVPPLEVPPQVMETIAKANDSMLAKPSM